MDLLKFSRKLFYSPKFIYVFLFLFTLLFLSFLIERDVFLLTDYSKWLKNTLEFSERFSKEKFFTDYFSIPPAISIYLLGSIFIKLGLLFFSQDKIYFIEVIHLYFFAFLYSLAIPFIYYLLKKSGFTKQISLVAILLIILNINPLWKSNVSDVFVALSFLIALLCMFSYIKEKKLKFYLFSILFTCLALLTRFSALSLLVIFPLLLYTFTKNLKFSFKRYFAWFFSVILLTIFLWPSIIVNFDSVYARYSPFFYRLISVSTKGLKGEIKATPNPVRPVDPFSKFKAHFLNLPIYLIFLFLLFLIFIKKNIFLEQDIYQKRVIFFMLLIFFFFIILTLFFRLRVLTESWLRYALPGVVLLNIICAKELIRELKILKRKSKFLTISYLLFLGLLYLFNLMYVFPTFWLYFLAET